LVVLLYNGMIRARNHVREAWSGINTQLKRRHDLIPRLVEAVKGYMSYEKELLAKITSQRTASMALNSVKEKGEAERTLSSSLRSLFAVAENYPDIKANTTVADLQKALIDTEDQLQYARRYYNGTVRDFNIRLETFPGNIVAGIFRFEAAEFFALEDDSEKKTPEVKI
jgi:LemA protein